MRSKFIIILIIFIAGLAYIPFLGQLHLFDWDEINFAESAREMIRSGDYLNVQIGFEAFWEKPPLFIWFQVLSMKIFGINEFAARFPNAICGILTLVTLYLIGRKIRDDKFALIWVLFYGCSILPFTYFKSGIIDPWFNYFIFTAVYSFHRGVTSPEKKWNNLWLLISGVLLGLAVLTKGPASVLMFAITCGVYIIIVRFKVRITFINSILFIFSLIFIGGLWFLLQIANGNLDIIKQFIDYQIRLFQTKDAGHGGFPMYHFIILLFGVFPASVFAIQGHASAPGETDTYKTFRKIMIILLWTVLILFSIVKTKIVHYSSLTYFPITFLATHSLYHIINKKFRFRLWMAVLLGFVAMLLGALIILLPFFDSHKQWLIDNNFITHPFTIGNLQANPGFNISEVIIGVFLIAVGAKAMVDFRLKRIKQGFLVLSLGTALFIYSTLLIVAPKAEKYSQNALIEFCTELKGSDVYLHPFFKSYAVWFYPDTDPDKKEFLNNEQWLRTGEIDKPVYYVIRQDQKEKILNEYPGIEYLYEKNGFVFCKRIPENK